MVAQELGESHPEGLCQRDRLNNLIARQEDHSPAFHYDTKLIASRVEEAFKINKRMDDRGTGLLRLSSTRSAASKSKTLHRKDDALTGHSKFDKSVVSD